MPHVYDEISYQDASVHFYVKVMTGSSDSLFSHGGCSLRIPARLHYILSKFEFYSFSNYKIKANFKLKTIGDGLEKRLCKTAILNSVSGEGRPLYG